MLIILAKSCETVREARGFKEDNQPLVLLISIDGFANYYLENITTPILDSLISVGIKADAFIPVFPSKTFPNHYTQVTGLYPENHGIVSNRMYDKQFDEYFTIGSESTTTDDDKWYQGEPVWVTAKEQGLTTATMFWPGSEAAINGIRPDYYFPFNGAVSEAERISQVLTWMDQEINRPHLITLYFEQIDQVGHLHGPNSRLLESAVEQIDQQLGSLMTGIAQLGLSEDTNIVIVSDHGMAQISRERIIFLDDYVTLQDVEVVNWSPVLELIPRLNKETLVYNQLLKSHNKLQVYRKSDMPERWHFNNHRRITPIIAVAEPGWSITSRIYFAEHPQAYTGGAHGNDPNEPSMHGIFIASGPSFRVGGQINAVESVHLYELLCELLEIVPAENDGDLKVWGEILN